MTTQSSQTGPLLVFDFDHTITDLNTDVEVQKLAPGGEIPASSEMRGLYSDKGWTEFMGAVFSLLHENGVSKVGRPKHSVGGGEEGEWTIIDMHI